MSGAESPVFGFKDTADSDKFVVPENTYISKVVFYADRWNETHYLGGLGLYDQNGKNII